MWFVPAEKKWISSVGRDGGVSDVGLSVGWTWGRGVGSGGGDYSLRFGTTAAFGGRAERVTTMVAGFQTSVGGGKS